MPSSVVFWTGISINVFEPTCWRKLIGLATGIRSRSHRPPKTHSAGPMATGSAHSPKSGVSYGLTFGVFVTENVEIEFALDQQKSALEASGRGTKREFTDMNVNNYHGNFVYNWGYDRDPVRPFLFGGLGATQFKPTDVMGTAVDSSTRFSTNWGGGVKIYPARNVGIKLLARWTPTYIKSDPGGIWCSPYWPWVCYRVADTQYSDQFQLAVGVTLRF